MSQCDLFMAPVAQTVSFVPDLHLRDYQQTARERVVEVWTRKRGALVVIPTGTGKSRLGGAVAWDLRVQGGKTLILCPTIVLCEQMYRDMRGLGLRAGIEQADNRCDLHVCDVVIASVASMRGLRLKSFKRDAFACVMADECHRSTSGMYREIFEHFEGAKLLGLTATPDRTDGVGLCNVFDEVAYEMSMLDAISKGWLVPLRFQTAVTNFDPKAIRVRQGEVDPGSVAKELVRSGLLHEAAGTLAELAEGERTVAFMPTVASSKAFVVELLARNVPAAHIDGTTPSILREDTFKRFRDGDIRVLSNVAVLTEGWDMPVASVIALLSPTRSRAKLAQMIGRSTRLSPGKTSSLIIDFVPGRLRKGRLASPADALAGKMLDDDVHQHIGQSGDLAHEIERAEKTAADIRELKEKAELRAKERAERLAAMKSMVKPRRFDYSTQSHDAGAILGGFGQDNGYSRSASVAGPTEDEIEMRKRLGLCSHKQSAILRRNGLNPDLSWKLAGVAIDAIASNGWKAPDHIRNDKRFQLKPAGGK